MPRVPLLLLMCFGALVSAPGQDLTESKIRLMSEALRARDAGDVPAAQRALADLIALAPNDPAAQRLRAEIEAQAAAQQLARQNQAAEAERAAREAARAAAAAQAAPRLPDASTPRMIDVHIPEPGQPLPPTPAAPSPEAEALARADAARVNATVIEVEAKLAQARTLLKKDKLDEAQVLLDAGLAALPVSSVTQRLLANLKREKANVFLARARASLRRGDLAGARTALAAHVELAPGSTRAAGLERQIDKAERRQAADALPTEPVFVGPIVGIPRGLTPVPPKGAHAIGAANVVGEESSMAAVPPMQLAPQKLGEIVLPALNFANTPLPQVVAELNAAAAQFDVSGDSVKGLNLVLLDPTGRAPGVTLAVRNVSVKRALDFVTESIGYRYEVQSDAVVIRPGMGLSTRFFPLSAAAVRRITTAVPAASGENPVAAIRAFLQQAGVTFGDNAAIAYDGSALVVTQTPANLERVEGLLAHYKEVRQVIVEARFVALPAGTLGAGGVAAPGAGFASVLAGPEAVAAVRALAQREGVEFLSAPRITTLSGSAASMTTGQSPTASQQVAAELRVTPTVRDDDRSITLDLQPKVTTTAGFTEATTQVVLDDGSTVILSGLLAQKRELLIIVTARIVKPEGGTTGF